VITTKLTGNRRHVLLTRIFRRPVLVLQVEEQHTGYTIESSGGSCIARDVNHASWRDARVEDICLTESVVIK